MGGYVEPALDDHEIQGHVLAGFKKPHQWLIGFDIVDVAAARRWLGQLAPALATLAQVAAHNHDHHEARRGRGQRPAQATWLSLALSFRGLLQLRPDARELLSPAFQQGVAARGVWPSARPNAGEPHLLIVVAADEVAGLGKSLLGDAATIRDPATATARGLRLVFFHAGENRDGREHFGFADGVSQPGVRGTLPSRGQAPLTPRTIAWDGDATDARFREINEPELAAPGQPLVWPGEFVLGYPAQDPRHPRRPQATVLAAPWWARNGSFAVYLRFRQDVAAFRQFVAAEAARLGLDPALVAARLIGRWPSGAPLVRRPNADDGVPANHFGYADPVGTIEAVDGQVSDGSAGDVRGAACPFSAHIRKVNPRDEATEEGASARSLKRRILRRGISYGPPWEQDKNGDRGILFLAFQASLEEQFEVLYRDWILDDSRPAGPGGPDLLVTGGGPGAPRRFVELVEGGYFFMPAISAVRLLAQQP
jgi:Dyp-type peroxidase family